MNNKGNAYILVVVVIGLASIMVGISLYLSKIQFNVATAYKESGGLYALALSGAENTSYIISQIVESYDAAARASAISSIANGFDAYYSIENYVQYGFSNDAAPDGYSKNFYLIENNLPNRLYQKYYLDNLNKYVVDELKNYMTYVNYWDLNYNLFNLNYSVVSQNKEVSINIKLTIDSTTSIKNYVILATATDIESGDTAVCENTLIINLPVVHDEILYEEYIWRDGMPEYFNHALLLNGDLLLENSNVKIGYNSNDDLIGENNNVLLKGYVPNHSLSSANDFGGIRLTSGSSFKVNGDVYTNSAIQTNDIVESEVFIKGDVVASKISINDNVIDVAALDSALSDNYNTIIPLKNHNITITGDAYLYDDLFISKYSDDCSISVEGDVYGIGKSSAVYNKSNDDDTLVTIGGRVFLNGTAFLRYNYNNTINNIALHESVGEPFEPLEDLIDYLNNEDVTGAFWDENSYYTDRLDEVNFSKVFIGGSRDIVFGNKNIIKGYSAGFVSANGTSCTSSDVLLGVFTETWTVSTIVRRLIASATDAEFFFNRGLKENKEYFRTNSSPNKLGEEISPFDPEDNRNRSDIKPILTRLGKINAKWLNLIADGSFYVSDIIYNSGLKGYMDKLTNLPDMTFNQVSLPTSQLWSKQRPIVVVNENQTIDVSRFYDDSNCIPMIIISNSNSSIITLTASDKDKNKFKGLIFANGKIEILDSIIEIEGIIVASSNNTSSPIDATSIVSGNSSALYIKNSEVIIKYNPNILLDLYFKDVSLKRKIFDYFKLTDYKSVGKSSVIAPRNIKNITKLLKIKNNSPVIINGWPPAKLELIKQKQS